MTMTFIASSPWLVDLDCATNGVSASMTQQSRPIRHSLRKNVHLASVALRQREYTGSPNSDERLDYGSRNPIMRMFFDRAIKELEAQPPKPLQKHFCPGVVFPQPRTQFDNDRGARPPLF